MSSLGRIARGVRGPELQATAFPETPGFQAWLEVFRQAAPRAGVTVTVDNALGLPAVWAAVWVVADIVGSLPLITYQRGQGEDRERAPEHPAYALLHDRPNPEMPASVCWSVATAHMRTYGDAFLGKTFQAGRVVELWPIRPDRVRVQRVDGRKVYLLADDNGTFSTRQYTSREILQVMGPSVDGLRGISPIDAGRETIGAGLAMDMYLQTLMANNCIPGGILKTAKSLSDDARVSLLQQWEAKYRGAKNRGKLAVLEDGLEYQQMGLSLEDAQFAEVKAEWAREIARLWRVPASAIEASKGDSLTYSTVEMDTIALINYSCRPGMVRLTQALSTDPDLFPPADRAFCEFLPDALLQADTKSRYEAYQIALDPRTGWMKQAEVRRKENLPRDESFDDPRELPAPRALPAPALP